MTRNNLNFHQTFPPTAEFIMRLLEICESGEHLTKEEISERTGIPTGKSSGKVEPHICYAKYMGLLEDKRAEGKHQLMFTQLGQELLNQDPGLQEKVSTAVCHSRIASLYGGAPLWAAMYKKVLPKYPQGISELLLKDELEKLFGAPIKMGPFLSSYCGMFNNLGLLSKEESKITMSKSTIDKELIYVYAYSLLYEWKGAFPDQAEITATELDSMKIAETFLLDNKAFYNVLEMLAEKSIVRFNRQLAPFTLLRLHTAEEIIPKLFSELC